MAHRDSPARNDSPERLARYWNLDSRITFLNHGSFGACPREVLAAQDRYRAQMEGEPVRFFVRELEPLLDAARGELAAFVHCDADDLVFVANATAGVNAVLRSLSFEPDDELLTTDHEYNACRNVLNFVAGQSGARVVVAETPFPLASADAIADSILECVTPRTRLALVDHVTSQTALVFPIARIVQELSQRGIDTLVDGAHAPGMVPLDVRAIGAAYYTGNCHKWMCAPKGAGFLHVRRDRQKLIRPAIISHGANSPRTDRSKYQLEFGWVGTLDPTPFLCVADAIRFMGGLLHGHWPTLMEHNRRTTLAARASLCDRLGVPIPCPAELIGAMASIPLPDSPNEPAATPLYLDPLQDALLERFDLEVPIIPWPQAPKRLIRISAQVYNHAQQYGLLADALSSLLR